MKLYVMRHGFAGSPSNDPKKERERELKDEGAETVQAIAKEWAKSKDVPSVVFCSPLTRAQQTADIIGAAFKIQVNVIGDLAPQRPLEEGILQLVGHGEQKRVLLVCHKDNTTPSMNNLGGDVKWEDLVMGEVRRVDIDRKTGEWTMKWALKPSDIGLVDHDD